MNPLKTNHSCSSRCLLVQMKITALAVLALASVPVARASDDNRAPDLPSPLCDRLQVQAGNRVAFHVYALGVQIYRWDGTSWVFVAPSARLFADAEYHGEVGIHYAGPTWESTRSVTTIPLKAWAKASLVSQPCRGRWLRNAAFSSDCVPRKRAPGPIQSRSNPGHDRPCTGLAPALHRP